MEITCPHCGVENPSDAQFCESCGKALPAHTGPRIVGSDEFAETDTGRQLQSEQMKKEAGKAAGALLAVAILQAVFGTFIVLAAGSVPGIPEGTTLPPIVFVVVYGIAVLFFGLYLWARRDPFPAAIVGLVVFVSVHLLDALADPTALARGIVVKIVVLVVLVRAIKAGAAHRAMVRQA